MLVLRAGLKSSYGSLFLIGVACSCWSVCARTLTNMNMRPQHITITSIKYLISYPINMKVSNQVFTTSNSNKCVGGLYLCMYVFIRVK